MDNNMNYKETRPWGNFENLLDTDYCKVKQIVIKQGQAPSYQYHFKREEVWVVVQGKGELKLNDKIIPVTTGQIIHVPIKAKHPSAIKDEGTLTYIILTDSP